MNDFTRFLIGFMILPILVVGIALTERYDLLKHIVFGVIFLAFCIALGLVVMKEF